jgi:DNA-binding transcriptional LysR family regulator
VLRVGTLPINIHDMRPYWDTFRANHPQWRLRFQQAYANDPFAGLRRGDIDVLIAWLPVEEPDLTVGPILFTEPRVLAVATDHDLARYTSISLEIVGDFQHPDIEAAPAHWVDSYVPSHTRKGRQIERGPHVHSGEQALVLTSTGEVVTLFPLHMTRYGARPDITYLPVKDIHTLSYALVWRTESENDLIRALAGTIHDLGPLDHNDT